MSKIDNEDWLKVDLHIHTLDDPKDVIDYSAHQLLERAKQLGFGVLAITLHDAVFDRTEVFADAAAMGILLIPAAEVRLQGADAILLNVTASEVAGLKNFEDLRQLRARRGMSIFTIAPHPFYVLGGSIGPRLLEEIDCFDAIELCHFHKGLLRASLHEHSAFNGVDDRECFCRSAPRSLAPDQSAGVDGRSCQRHLLDLSCASVQTPTIATPSPNALDTFARVQP